MKIRRINYSSLNIPTLHVSTCENEACYYRYINHYFLKSIVFNSNIFSKPQISLCPFHQVLQAMNPIRYLIGKFSVNHLQRDFLVMRVHSIRIAIFTAKPKICKPIFIHNYFYMRPNRTFCTLIVKRLLFLNKLLNETYLIIWNRRKLMNNVYRNIVKIKREIFLRALK